MSSTLLQPARCRSRTHDLSNASESKVFNPFNDSGPGFKLVGSASWGAAGPLHGSRSHRRCRCADVSDREACEPARCAGLGAIVAHRDSQGLLRRLEPKWGALAWETSSASATRTAALRMARACRREHRCRPDRRCRDRLTPFDRGSDRAGPRRGAAHRIGSGSHPGTARMLNHPM